MPEHMLTPSSPEAIVKLIEEWSSFTRASRALDGLTPGLATTKPEGWPHSIAEVVAHMLSWQKHDLATIETGVEADVTPAESWPVVTQNDWPRLHDEFLASLNQCREIARDSANLDRPILEGRISVGLRLVWFTGHNAYHLGQVVLMRRIIGVWPPPGGGME